MCAGMEKFPRCSDLLEPCRAVSIITLPECVNEAGAAMAIGRSDILILDEAALVQDALDSICGLLASQPLLKSLLGASCFGDEVDLFGHGDGPYLEFRE